MRSPPGRSSRSNCRRGRAGRAPGRAGPRRSPRRPWPPRRQPPPSRWPAPSMPASRPRSRAGRSLGQPPALPMAATPAGTEVTDLALSPNGTRLAVEVSLTGAPALHVFALSSGADRTYHPGGIGTSTTVGTTQDSLSWTADGRTLAFIYWGAPGGGGVRLLDTAAPGSDLLANSRLAVGQPPSATEDPYWIQARVAPDGQTILGIRDPRGRAFSQQLVAFSARTGQVVRVLNNLSFRTGNDEQILWMSPSGDKLIITDARPGPKAQAPSA